MQAVDNSAYAGGDIVDRSDVLARSASQGVEAFCKKTLSGVITVILTAQSVLATTSIWESRQ